MHDFDEAVVGPWRLDVLRLMTSLCGPAENVALLSLRAPTKGTAMTNCAGFCLSGY